jgi:hypothetical protein
LTAYRTAAADTLHLAFALGGLAGNNAHGAGFLQAALDTEARPEFISCTSGQILWVHRYLQARMRGKPAAATTALRNELVRDIDEMERFHQPDLDLITLALFGRASIFRLSSHEYMLDTIRNMMRSFERTLED